MYFLFNALLLPIYPFLLGYTLWRCRVRRRSLSWLRLQWSRVPAEVPRTLHEGHQEGLPIIWLHAASMGETMAARPVARALREAMPGCRIGLSIKTHSGYETAQAALKAGDVNAVFYLPVDLPFAIGPSLRDIRPQAFLTIETELWPNILHLARRGGTRTFLVNGRVSDRMLETVPRFKPLWRWVFSNLDAALMRSEIDAARLRQLVEMLGVGPREIMLAGDVKLDTTFPDETGDARRAARERWREIWSVDSEAPLWVAGSTHPGEEEMILSAFASLRKEFPALRLVIAARHIERSDEVERLIARQFPVLRRTQTQQGKRLPDAVGLLDTVGELAELYAAADVTFVGGSLIERGGHNMLEPVLQGVPVLFGPFVMNFRNAASLVESCGVGVRVQNEEELREATAVWLRDAEKRAHVPQMASEALEPHRGAARRVAEFIAARIKQE